MGHVGQTVEMLGTFPTYGIKDKVAYSRSWVKNAEMNARGPRDAYNIELRCKLLILRHAEENGRVVQTCRYFGIARSTYYRWRHVIEKFPFRIQEIRTDNGHELLSVVAEFGTVLAS